MKTQKGLTGIEWAIIIMVCLVIIGVMAYICLSSSPASATTWPQCPIPPDGYYSVYQIDFYYQGHALIAHIQPGVLFWDDLPEWITELDPFVVRYLDSTSKDYLMVKTRNPNGERTLKLVRVYDPNSGLSVSIQGE
jgi:hypothetical protein